MTLTKSALAILCAGLLSPGAALAQEETLRFKLVVTMTNETELSIPTVPDQSIIANEAVGVAYFDDGRVAFKRFVITSVGGEMDGTYTGLSTYTFENGDLLNLKFTGGWTPDGEQAEYTVLSGEGAFEGATGIGTLNRIEASWDDAYLLDGTFTVQVP